MALAVFRKENFLIHTSFDELYKYIILSFMLNSLEISILQSLLIGYMLLLLYLMGKASDGNRKNREYLDHYGEDSYYILNEELNKILNVFI